MGHAGIGLDLRGLGAPTRLDAPRGRWHKIKPIPWSRADAFPKSLEIHARSPKLNVSPRAIHVRATEIKLVIILSKESQLEYIELKSLKGKFLAASPAMGDPRFSESLIWIVHHDETGAAGFIVNHPVDSLSFYGLLEQLDLKNPKGVEDHMVFSGGPVQANNGFVLYLESMGLRDEIHVANKVYYSRSIEGLKRIAEGRGPDFYSICLGRAEWAPGQLEQELTENVWLPSTGSTDLIFGEQPDRVWSQVLGDQGISSLNFTSVAGHA